MVKHNKVFGAVATLLAVGGGVVAPSALAIAEEDLTSCANTEQATIDAECYATDLVSLKAGLENAAVSRIVLNQEIAVTESESLSVSAGKEVQSTAAMFRIKNGATLTLNGEGKLTAGEYLARVEGSSLIFDGPTATATNNAAYGVFVSEGGSATIKSGSITADYAAFAGNNITGDMNFYVEGGTLKSNRYPAIYMPGQVFLSMTGGTLDGGIVARLGQITIDGGVINAQVTPVEGDGLAANYGGMPSMTEAIALVGGGAYKSSNKEYGNSMNLVVNGGTINGEVAVYDLGNTAEAYQQQINVQVNGGAMERLTTKFTEEEIGFALKPGYTAGANNAAGRVTIDVNGGTFVTKPDEAEIGEDKEIENVDGGYRVVSKEEDLSEYTDGIPSNGEVPGLAWGSLKFNKEFVADRKAFATILSKDGNGLVLDAADDYETALVAVFDVSLQDRDGAEIEVTGSDLTVQISLTEEQYNALKAYSGVKVIYFDDNGIERERLDAELRAIEEGEGMTYILSFNTTHLSTYGVAGVNETAGDGKGSAGTPDTGLYTTSESGVSGGGVIALVASILIGGVVAGVLGRHFVRQHHARMFN